MPGQRYLVLLGVMLQVRGLWPPEPAPPPHHLKSWGGGGLGASPTLGGLPGVSGQPGLFLPCSALSGPWAPPGGLSVYDRGPCDVPSSVWPEPAFWFPSAFGGPDWWGSRTSRNHCCATGAWHRQEFSPSRGRVTCTPRPGHWGTSEGARGWARLLRPRRQFLLVLRSSGPWSLGPRLVPGRVGGRG